jgi:transposase
VLVAKGYRPVLRDQPFLFPPDMREWLESAHPVWTVMEIVQRLDTSAFHQRRRTGGVGRAGYDPDMVVTLLIWAWLQGARSSRRIERACADVVSYRVICAGDGPDHVTIARFRADNHGACEQLFTQVLTLAARLGLGRLETVALDGVKIASNASLSANRSGSANPGSVPAELADPASRAARIDEAMAGLDDTTPTDPGGPADSVGPTQHCAESTESVDSEPVPRDRSRRIAQALARIDAEIDAERTGREAMVGEYLARIAAGEKMTGRVPVEAKVALAERLLAEVIATVLAKHASWAARGPVGQRRAGRSPVPVEQHCRVRQARARLEAARIAAAAYADAAGSVERTANITDPQSGMQPLRGGGWLQGYNAQAVTTADGLIVATGVGTSPVDNRYYRDMIDKTVTAADLIAGHRPTGTSHEAITESIGTVLADAGYCTRENLTAPGPDRLIATGKARDLHQAATENPAADPAPEDADPITAMAHRLRTPEGITHYAKRSHIAETPFGHAKHNLGFRRFTSRGLARARSEWTFHAAVHNIGKILNHLGGTPLPA